jgi:hypothetical protein
MREAMTAVRRAVVARRDTILRGLVEVFAHDAAPPLIAYDPARMTNAIGSRAAAVSHHRSTAYFTPSVDFRVFARVRYCVIRQRIVIPASLCADVTPREESSRSGSPEVIMTQSLEEHHARAASHFDDAAEHHRAAERAYVAGNHAAAAYEAQLALGHSVQAHDHADLAAMAHVERHALRKHIAKKRRKK